jgi:hypothetical protein
VVGLDESDITPITISYVNNCEEYYVFNITFILWAIVLVVQLPINLSTWVKKKKKD